MAVRSSLENLRENRTTIVIAHRLSTVRDAQRIIVLTKDGIAEQGTHEELVAACGVYVRLNSSHLSM
jgi:ATP-binding cassette subfamily B protein